MKLCTHHHYGWRSHSAGMEPFDEAALMSALHSTHTFLKHYEGKYRAEIVKTPQCNFDGQVIVYWDSDEVKQLVGRSFLSKGDHWFKAFNFNFVDDFACRYCGGTGVDHYNPLVFCWNCDGTKKQVRTTRPRDYEPIRRPV
ncbi:hypothetical protein KEU06_09525 [Pseudaminobacter sp. 19-2017]|uniref:Uncharacterized protein n=1 Tax=Pseudaminobacter soli (ex Zhang et al. 2022) TaxID=2831468 RepID=A0A942I7Z2_9HYPH|nr:hypothetical protein [Pseudaminobacter soli]MBS3648845.1 hypothetical protein [Pseudaminobacter soli]